ncbi:MAG: HAMP domain-containing sensor histidine kinase [Pseudomonadota bacterium]
MQPDLGGCFSDRHGRRRNSADCKVSEFAMAQAQYPYLDLTVLDDVRNHIIAPNAALLFSRDLSRLLWANGEGASLIGASAIRPAIEGEFTLNPAMERQIRTAAGKLDKDDNASAIMRVRSGFKTRLVGFNVRLIALPDGEKGVFLLTENLRPRTHREADMASIAVEGLDGYSHASAIIGADGKVLAGSQHFDDLGVQASDLVALVQEVATEDDRLVKRPIETTKGAMPSGIARLSEKPASHLLVIASTNPADDTVLAAQVAETMDDPEADSVSDANALGVAALGAGAPQSDPDDTDAESDEPDVHDDGAAAKPVGAFSSKRGKLPNGAFSRWYYNNAEASKTENSAIDGTDTDGGVTKEPAVAAAVEANVEHQPEPSEAQTADGSPSDGEDGVDLGTVTAGVIGGAVGALGGAGAAVATALTGSEEDKTDDEATTAAQELATAGSALKDETDQITPGPPASGDEESALQKSGLVEEDFLDTDTGQPNPELAGTVQKASSGAAPGGDAFAFSASEKPTRFVWEMDGAGVFTSVSDELAQAVGPASADVSGLSWAEAAQLRGFKNGDVITALLEKGDTWSGKTVMWPVEGTDMRVPVDLAGLPSYNRDRQFNGFNGFGLVRTADAVVDPDAVMPDNRGPSVEEDGPTVGSVLTQVGAGAAALGTGALAATGLRRSNDEEPNSGVEDKVVDLRNRLTERAEKSDPAGKAGRDLSSDEREAFDEIAEKLSTTDAADAADQGETEKGTGDTTSNAEIIPSAFVSPPKGALETDSDSGGVKADASDTSGPGLVGAATAAVAGMGAASLGTLSSTPSQDDVSDQPNETAATETAGKSDTMRTPSHDVDTSILARLPIPVLVYRKDELLFGNDEFFDVTGYSDLQSLANSGGVEALFGASSALEESQQAQIFHRSGDRLPLRAHIQRVPWDEDKAMLLTLRDDDGSGGSSGSGGSDGSGGPDGADDDGGDLVPENGLDETSDSVSTDRKSDAGDAPSGSSEKNRPRLSLVATHGAAVGAGAASALAATALSGSDLAKNDEQPDQASLVPFANEGDGGERKGSEQTQVERPKDTSEERRSKYGSGGAFGGLDAEDLRGIVDTATDGVVIVSNDGHIRAMNRSAEALFDCEAERVSGRLITDLLAPESHRSAMDYLSGMNGTGVASLLNDGREVIGRTSGGGLIPLFMAFGKLQSTDACCAVLRDITSWKKAEEELLSAKALAESASTQKTEFLATISHEIRTPLNAIIGFSDMMVEERFGRIDNDRYRGYLRDISRSGNHVLELINDLLDISKIEAGKMELEFDACDLNTLVSETVALTQPEANKERVIIRTSLSAVVPKVVADQRSLRQIILNLVSNSIKFTKSGGQVIVSTVYDEAGEVVLRVRDTGIGMSELDLARALKPFEQVGRGDRTGANGSRSRASGGAGSSEGTGLGLPLTKAMVEANRASFHIESQLDEGTLVEIHFPSQRVLADR